jgi:hypothetical protein
MPLLFTVTRTGARASRGAPAISRDQFKSSAVLASRTEALFCGRIVYYGDPGFQQGPEVYRFRAKILYICSYQSYRVILSANVGDLDVLRSRRRKIAQGDKGATVAVFDNVQDGC